MEAWLTLIAVVPFSLMSFPNDVYQLYNESEIVDITPSIDDKLWISGQGHLYLFDPITLKFIHRYGRAEPDPYQFTRY